MAEHSSFQLYTLYKGLSSPSVTCCLGLLQAIFLLHSYPGTFACFDLIDLHPHPSAHIRANAHAIKLVPQKELYLHSIKHGRINFMHNSHTKKLFILTQLKNWKC